METNQFEMAENGRELGDEESTENGDGGAEEDEDGISVTEEAMAMAVVLAGNGTLMNREKRLRCADGLENDPLMV